MRALFLLGTALLVGFLTGCASGGTAPAVQVDERPLVTVFRHPT